jgi:hypothetical protein
VVVHIAVYIHLILNDRLEVLTYRSWDFGKCQELAGSVSTGYWLGTAGYAATKTFPEIRGMSHSGRLLPIRNSASAKISVTGNGNSVPETVILLTRQSACTTGILPGY